MTWHFDRLRAGSSAFAFLLFSGHVASAQGEVSMVLAGQLRAQGYPCDDHAIAKRDFELSNADELVWNVKCKTASYRMYLKPDTPARVEPLD